MAIPSPGRVRLPREPRVRKMFRYTFTFDRQTRIELEVDESTDTSPEPVDVVIPDWVRLDKFRCRGCALPVGSRRTCPAAQALLPVVETFRNHVSYEPVRVQVQTDRLSFEATLPAPDAARSVFGQLLALCACPVLRQLRPLAFYHLPFATRQHTAFRFLGSYLIGQVLRRQQGLPADWDLGGLLRLVDELHEVNSCLADRIRAASEQDAAVNSVIYLDAFAHGVEFDIEQGLIQLQPLFAAYLKSP